MNSKELAKYIAKLEDNEGRITPERLVESATPEDDPAHDLFEWDDAKAGQQHRLAQARQYLKKVEFIRHIGTTEVKTVKYVRDPDRQPREQGYRALDKIQTDEDAAHAMLADEFARARAVLTRARKLAQVIGMESEVARLQGEVTRLEQVIARNGQDATVRPEA